MTKEPSDKRRLWPSLYSEEEPIADVNAWIKVLAAIWFIYLLFNTKNPIGTLFTPSLAEFRMHGSLGLDIRLIFAGVLFLALVLGSVWWAFGSTGVRRLFPRLRVRDGFLMLWYGLLNFLLKAVGSIIGGTVHGKYVEDNASALDLGELDSWHNFWVVTGRDFFMFAGQVIALILFFLVLYQIGKKVLPQDRRFFRGLTKALAYLLAAAAYAALMTTPVAPNFGQNLWGFGLPALPLLAGYRRTRNVLVPIIGLFIFDRALVILLLAVSI